MPSLNKKYRWPEKFLPSVPINFVSSDQILIRVVLGNHHKKTQIKQEHFFLSWPCIYWEYHVQSCFLLQCYMFWLDFAFIYLIYINEEIFFKKKVYYLDVLSSLAILLLFVFRETYIDVICNSGKIKMWIVWTSQLQRELRNVDLVCSLENSRAVSSAATRAEWNSGGDWFPLGLQHKLQLHGRLPALSLCHPLLWRSRGVERRGPPVPA